MNGQGLQAVRGEIEAIVTFQSALNRLALSVDEGAVTEWTGPRPDEVDALASDDGTFSYQELTEVRKQAGEALATRYREVAQATANKPSLQAILAQALHAATGGVATLGSGPEAGSVLQALTRTGSLNLEWAQNAAIIVREQLELLKPQPAEPAKPPKVKKAKATKKVAATTKKKPAAKAKKVVSKKPAPKKAKAPKKKPTPAKRKR
jgi:hypothetical protein